MPLQEVVYGADLDGDGDWDFFDRSQYDHFQSPDIGSEQWEHTLDQIRGDNIIWEFLEDIGELFDGNPHNNSFEDGGNGSGDETPLVQSYWPPGGGPGGGLPVVLIFDGMTYTYLNGNFTTVDGGGPGGGGEGIFGV